MRGFETLLWFIFALMIETFSRSFDPYIFINSSNFPIRKPVALRRKHRLL